MAGELKYKDITEKIIGRAMKLPRKMGNGYNRYVYSKCLIMAPLTNQNLAQALNYSECHRLEAGLLLNFGAPGLQFTKGISQHKLHLLNSPVNLAQNPLNPRS
jgi:hypothetical protein